MKLDSLQNKENNNIKKKEISYNEFRVYLSNIVCSRLSGDTFE